MIKFTGIIELIFSFLLFAVQIFKRTSGKTGDLVVKPGADIFVALGRLFRAVELLAQVAPAVGRKADDLPVLFPVKIFRIQSRISVQDVEVLGQGLWRGKIGRVDVGMGRSVSRIIRTAVNDGNDVGFQGAVEFLCDVIGTQGILGGDVEFVVAQELVAVGPLGRIAFQMPASTVSVDRRVLGHFAEVFLPSAQSVAVGIEPGHQFGLVAQHLGMQKGVEHFNGIGRNLTFRQRPGQNVGHDGSQFAAEAAVRMAGKNVGIATVGHGPVEVIFQWFGEDGQPLPLAGHRFVVEEHVALGGQPVPGQIVDVEIVGVEDEGVALVGQTLVSRRQAVGVATAGGDERLTTQTKTEIVPAEESCP